MFTTSPSLFIAGAVQTKTAGYTALVTDAFINCSTNILTITLYPASGNAGKILVIKKTDTDITKIITIDGNASETIDGALTTTLNTVGEAVTLFCDGANWMIMSRVIPKVWTSYTGTITGTVIAGSISYTSNTLYWAREGPDVLIQGNIRVNVVTTAPTGASYINLPANITTAAQASSSDAGRGPWGTASVRWAAVSTHINWLTITAPNTSSMVFATGAGVTAVLANADEIKVNIKVPATGWN